MRAYPAGDFPVLGSTLGVRNLVVLVVPLHEVLQDGAALKDANLLAVQGICEGGNAAIGVDVEEPLLLLLILHHFNVVHLLGGVRFTSWPCIRAESVPRTAARAPRAQLTP